jgi:hypothetical protein
MIKMFNADERLQDQPQSVDSDGYSSVAAQAVSSGESGGTGGCE